ncbi:MAG: helix-hairpin-helix domain-containing protein [Actinomycetota bacterium]
METKETSAETHAEQVVPAPAYLSERLRARLLDRLRFHPREAGALAVLGLLLVIGAGLAYVRARPAAAMSAPSGAVATASPAASVAANTIIVDVAGAVRKPGVYDFPQGARVIDAIHKAGGFARGADPQAINLARPLVDGEQVLVPKVGETPAAAGGTGSAQQGGKININSAGVSDFDGLPGIGPVLAQKIVDYRQQHGPFRSIEDLMKVSGIGQAKFDSLKDLVTV